MAISFDSKNHGGRARSPLTPASEGFESHLSPAAGVPLIVPDGAEITVRPWGTYRAKMFIPCVYGRCPGRMQLRVAHLDNTPLERPFYLCDQNGGPDALWECPKSYEPVYPENIRGSFLSNGDLQRPGYKSNESRTRQELEHML